MKTKFDQDIQTNKITSQNTRMLHNDNQNMARIEVSKQIIFMEQKYDKIKKKFEKKKQADQLKKEDYEELGNIMNVVAMKYSQQGKNRIAQQWLKNALKYCVQSERIRIVTYNNLACIYKQSNDLGMALIYINKAQKEADFYCLEVKDDKLLAIMTDCSLNLCAIMSAMGDHYKALRAARKAITLLQQNQHLPPSYYNSLYPIAKYNEGAELQRLKLYQQAEKSYKEALKIESINPSLLQRLKKAQKQIALIISKTKKIQIQMANTNRRTKLSLPKFCHDYMKENKIELKKCKQRKSTIKLSSITSQSKGCITSRSKLKISKLGTQNYYTNPNIGKIRKNILQSIDNY